MTKWNQITDDASLPTKADGDHDGDVFWGNHHGKHIGGWDTYKIASGITAWAPTGIEVLPSEEKEPGRVEAWLNNYDGGAVNSYHENERSARSCYDKGRKGRRAIHLREVREADPDPGACWELIENIIHRGDLPDSLAEMARKCRGGDAT